MKEKSSFTLTFNIYFFVFMMSTLSFLSAEYRDLMFFFQSNPWHCCSTLLEPLAKWHQQSHQGKVSGWFPPEQLGLGSPAPQAEGRPPGLCKGQGRRWGREGWRQAAWPHAQRIKLLGWPFPHPRAFHHKSSPCDFSVQPQTGEPDHLIILFFSVRTSQIFQQKRKNYAFPRESQISQWEAEPTCSKKENNLVSSSQIQTVHQLKALPTQLLRARQANNSQLTCPA